jgi:hypothetical protein
LKPPVNGSGLAIDPASPKHAIAGGSSIQVSADGGVTWKPTQAGPPGKGPYQPLGISPFDGNVWFFLHQGHLLRTRDGSLTWTELTGLPSLSSPVVVPGPVFGQFFIAAGSRVFQLVDNGQKVTEEPPLAQSNVSDLAVVDGNRPILLARATNGVFALNGSTWVSAGGGLGGPVAAGATGTMVVGNGGDKIGTPGLISYSANGGTTWTQAIGLPYDQTVEAIAGQVGSGNFFAYCYGGDIYTSSDGGRVWTLLSRALRTSSS